MWTVLPAVIVSSIFSRAVLPSQLSTSHFPVAECVLDSMRNVWSSRNVTFNPVAASCVGLVRSGGKSYSHSPVSLLSADGPRTGGTDGCGKSLGKFGCGKPGGKAGCGKPCGNA